MNARLLWMAGLAAAMGLARADSANPAVPEAGFSGDRYEALWNKSPFAVATAEASVASAAYQLVGLAQFDGVSYASLVDKSTQEHFVLASDKPVRGLALVSISHDAAGIGSAIIEHNGDTLVLRQGEGTPDASGPTGTTASPNPPSPRFALPADGSGGALPAAYLSPHRALRHRPAIAVPPRPEP